MSRKVYNKLVRSEIPDIIKSEGKQCTYIELDPYDETEAKIITTLIKEKIVEEANEVLEAKTKGQILEEIADLYDIIDELLSFLSQNRYFTKEIKDDIEIIRKAKSISKGKFIKLVSTNNKSMVDNPRYIKLLSVDYEN